MMEALRQLGVYKVVILTNQQDVTYYLDQPATRDPNAPYSVREFQVGSPMRLAMEAFEHWLGFP